MAEKEWDTAINRRTKSVKVSPSTATEPMGSNQATHSNKKRHPKVPYFVGGKNGILACATIPDKQWVSTVYPKGKFVNKFSP